MIEQDSAETSSTSTGSSANMRIDSTDPAAEQTYDIRLTEAAKSALGDGWQDHWPQLSDERCSAAYYVDGDLFVFMSDLIRKVKDEGDGSPVLCTVENISIPWCVQLGAVYDIDPAFFIDHVRRLGDKDFQHSLCTGIAPNSSKGLKSTRGQKQWVTLRGFVDYGTPNEDLGDDELPDSTHRRNSMGFFARLSHTNLSLYKVSENLSFLLVDRMPDYQDHFILNNMRWFPFQTQIRIAMLNSPKYLTIPRLMWSDESPVWPFWNLLNDETYRAVLLDCLRNDHIDEFLYQACCFETEYQLKWMAIDIDAVSGKQHGSKEDATTEILQHIQKALDRLKACIEENRAYEVGLMRAATLTKEGVVHRNDFETFTAKISGLDALLNQCFNRLLMTQMLELGITGKPMRPSRSRGKRKAWLRWPGWLSLGSRVRRLCNRMTSGDVAPQTSASSSMNMLQSDAESSSCSSQLTGANMRTAPIMEEESTYEPEQRAQMQYESTLDRLAAEHLNVESLDDYFVHLKEGPRMAHHSEAGNLETATEVVRRVLADRKGKAQAVCVIEAISLEWAIELGTALKLDPLFFIEYVRSLEQRDRYESLVEACNPSTVDGLKSGYGDDCKSWCTIRGVVDHGVIREDSEGWRVPEASRRCVDTSRAGECLSHTNVSVYKVHQNLTLVLVDQLPSYHDLFVLDEPGWYPNQTTIRVAMLDSPAYLSIPQMCYTTSTAVFPLWSHFRDGVHRRMLMAELATLGADDFFYKATFFECERHLILLSQEIEDIGRNEIVTGGMDTNQRLHDIRRVLHRLKVCVQENRSQEIKVRRARSLEHEGGKCGNREDFESLVVMVKDLETSLVQAFQLLMSTMSVTEMPESLAQTKATHEQTRSMNMLTRLAVFYAPLSFAASIFGMNTQEINGSYPSLQTFGAVAAAVLALSVVVIIGGRCLQALRGRPEDQQATLEAAVGAQTSPSENRGSRQAWWRFV